MAVSPVYFRLIHTEILKLLFASNADDDNAFEG